MEKSCAAPGQQREGDGGSPSAGSMAAAPERPGTTGTSVRVKDDLRRRASGNQGGTVNARMPSPLSMGWRHLFLKGDVLWTVCVVTVRWSIWGRNLCSSGNTVFDRPPVQPLFRCAGGRYLCLQALRQTGVLPRGRAQPFRAAAKRVKQENLNWRIDDYETIWPE